MSISWRAIGWQAHIRSDDERVLREERCNGMAGLGYGEAEVPVDCGSDARPGLVLGLQPHVCPLLVINKLIFVQSVGFIQAYLFEWLRACCITKREEGAAIWERIPNSGNQALVLRLSSLTPSAGCATCRHLTCGAFRHRSLRDMVDHHDENPQTSNSKQQSLLQQLRASCKDDTSRVSVVHHIMTLPLSPSRCGQEIETVREIIQRKEFTYVPELKGFLLAVENLKLAEKYGVLKGDLPYIFWDAEADFFVFRPLVGTIIQGIVNKFGLADNSTITCLVHGSFPASVLLPESISPSLSPHILLGKEIKFQVTKVDFIKCLLVGVVNEECIVLMNVKQENGS